MGSKSHSRSTQVTENNSTTFGIQGDNSGLVLNGSGNTITDSGAFEIIGNFAAQLPELLNMGLGAVTDLALTSERNNENLLNTAGDLFGEVSNSQNEMMQLGAQMLTDTGEILYNAQANAFDFGRHAINQVGDTADAAMNNVTYTADSAIQANLAATREAMSGNSDLAQTVANSLENANNNNSLLADRSMLNAEFLAGRSMDNSSLLAQSLSRTALDSGNEANSTAMKQLQDGFESMMGFAEQYSRSDGAALAENNNKTMMYTLGGAALFAGAIVLAGRK